MKILDRFFNRFGYTKKTQKRSYDAGITNRLTSDWALSIRSADQEIRYALRTMRSRSRELERNNDYAKKFLQMCVTNIVGPSGITFQNKAKDTDGRLDKYANDTIEQNFSEWAKKGTCTVDGTLSWVEIQRLAIESTARDGEVLIRKVNGYPNKYSFALQVIEADRLNEDHNAKLNNGNQIKMGVEIDTWERPVAYHIMRKHPGDYASASYAESLYERVPADEIIHLFIKKRPGQTRGVPWMHTAMTRLKMLGGYEEAELVAARVAASKMGFYTSEAGDSYNGDDVDDKGNLVSEAEPGTFEQLPSGTNFTAFDPTHPAGNYPFFVKALLRGIASGLGVSYNSLANDLESVNYSSIRAGSIEERDNWKIYQQWCIDSLCQSVFEAWLQSALLTVLTLPVTKFAKFNAPSWKVRGWEWVDPLKDAKANIQSIQEGLSTRSQVLAEQGLDIEEVFEELQNEKQLAAQYGLIFPSAGNVMTATSGGLQ